MLVDIVTVKGRFGYAKKRSNRNNKNIKGIL